MLAYLKLKTNDEELYETDYLKELQQKQTKFSRLQYYICKYYFNFVAKLKYYMNIITVKQIYNAYLFILPFEEINNKQKFKKCINTVKKLMNRYNINALVSDEKIKKDQNFGKIIEPELKKVHILDGRGIMPYLIKETLEYELQRRNLQTQLEDLYICIKEPNEMYIDNIVYLIKYFRTVNIVTPNIKTFQKLADKIEQKENTILTVANNKKKSLKKARIIINFDLLENEINKYTIYREAVILTIDENGFYESDTFNGTQIRKIKIDTSDEIKKSFEKYNLLTNNDLTILYESTIDKRQKLAQIRNKIQHDKVKIVKLYGKNGSL